MNYLKQKLEEKNMTQAELARRIGVDASTVCNWIKDRSKISSYYARHIASILNLDIKEFIEEIIK